MMEVERLCLYAGLYVLSLRCRYIVRVPSSTFQTAPGPYKERGGLPWEAPSFFQFKMLIFFGSDPSRIEGPATLPLP